MNSVISLDLSQVPPKREVVSPDFLTPEARTYHCSVVIGTFMYTFGGGDANTDDNEKFYNDLWQFDFLSSRWTFINSLGEIPSKRKNFGCSKSFGDVFAVFGGIGEDGFLGDFYFFHESFKTWHRIQADLFPSARSGACLTYHNYRYFVIGGKNSEKGFNEIWMYLVESNRFLLMDEPIFKDGNDIYDAKCWVDEEGENPEIVLVGGCNFLNVPNAFTIRARVFYQNNTCLVNQNYKNKNDNMPLVVAAGSVLVKNEDSLFIVGGVLFDYIMTCPIRVKNLKTNEYSKYDTPNHLNIYGATGVHYKKSFYIFSGGGASDTFKSSYQLSSNIYKITFNSSDSFSLPCSEGHQIEKCIPCPQGTYSNNGSCKSCPKGRYSKTLAATSIEQCQPCAAGSFSSKEGSFHCFDCPVGYTCPIGSSEPKVNFELPQNNSVQPGAYENKKPFISFIVVNLWYSLAGVAVFILVICLIFSGVWRKIKDLDIFVSYHSSDLGKPVVHRKTRIGGVFSVLFEIASIITVIAAFLSFQMDNVSEIKTLIPIMILDEKITAKEITVTSTFYIYGGECSYEKMCNPNIIYEDSGLSYTFRSISCTTLNENCEIKAKYTNLELSSKTSEIQLKLKEKSSYSSSISVNITSTSSIPNQISSIFTSFTTGSTETLFRGTTGSKVYFKFTPSVKIIQLFTSESSDWASKETGFHVSSPQEPERGSLSTRSTVNIQIHLLLNIVILESDTAMKTIRTLNQSIFVFLGALLGSIFGLMGTFSTVMGYTEAFLEKVENKRKKISRVNEMKSRLGVLKAEFGKWVVLRRSKKVVPIDTAQSVIITCQ